MAERNLETSPLYKLTITGRQADRQTGGQTEKATYRGTSLRSAQKKVFFNKGYHQASGEEGCLGLK